MRSVFSFVVVILFLLLGNQVLVAKGLLDDSTNRTRKEQEEEEEDPLASSSPSSHSSSSSHDDENHPINNGTYYYKKGKLSNDVVVNYHREKFERTNRFLELMHDIVDGEKEEEDTRYVVKYKDGISFQTATARGKFGAHEEAIDVIPKDKLQVVRLSSLEQLQEMEEREDVEYVERDHKVYLQQAFSEEVPYGITMVKALDVPDDNVSNRKVCIVDTGYDLSHPDLPKSTTGVTISGIGAGNLNWFEDGNGHGTHVAGTIAAVGDNGRGVVGVVGNSRLNLHIVRVFNNNGVFVWASSLVSAVEECVDSGANVVNMSLGGGGFAQFERDAYNRIYEEDGVLLVAAAGNGGNTAFSYPASYPAVMSVAAVDSDGNIASFSQRNSQVEIAAPGVGVLSTVSGGRYRRFDGTSMACPHVAGVAALVWSNFPQKSAAEIRQALTKSATDLGPSGRDNIYGYGLVQADRAYQLLNGDLTLNPTAAPTPELPCFDSPAGWFDSDGENYNCQWYSRFSRCRLYGSRFENPDNGKTANEACCACGGGQRGKDHSETGKPSSLASSLPSQSPPGTKSQTPSARPTTLPSPLPTESKLPTSKPTRSGTSSSSPSSDPSLNTTPAPTAVPNEPTCTDTENWYDSRGMRFNCNFYERRRRRCRFAGNFFRNFDQTAKEACCVCGGGTTSNRTLLV